MSDSRPSLYFLASFGQPRVGFPEGFHRCTSRAGSPSRGLEVPLHPFGDLEGRPSQHLGVKLGGPGLDFPLDLAEQRDQDVAVELHPSRSASLAKAS